MGALYPSTTPGANDGAGSAPASGPPVQPPPGQYPGPQQPAPNQYPGPQQPAPDQYPGPQQPAPGQYPPPQQYPPGQYPPPQQYPTYPYPPPQGPQPGAPVQGYAVAPGAGGVPQQQMVMVPAPGTGPQPLPNWWPSVPIDVDCPGCHSHVTTHVHRQTGLGTWLIAGGTALAGCIFGCCLIPFCVDACKDTIHTCPKCNRALGIGKLVG